MGNDGGSIPDRRDLVRSKPKAEQADKANQQRARWSFCALSKRPLQEPIVSCALGKLYNKDALLEYLLDKSAYGDGEEICGHIRSLKDVKQLKLIPNPSKGSSPSSESARAQFVCPLTFKEMNGVQPFAYLASCGCVFSHAGFKTVTGVSDGGASGKGGEASADARELCPQCATKFAPGVDVRTLNPPKEEAERLRFELLAARAAAPTKKSKKRKSAAADAVATDGDTEEAAPDKKKKRVTAPTPSTNPGMGAASRAVVASLALEEAKRKAGMSDAVRSLYTNKDGPQRKETFMTMGTFTRYA